MSCFFSSYRTIPIRLFLCQKIKTVISHTNFGILSIFIFLACWITKKNMKFRGNMGFPCVLVLISMTVTCFTFRSASAHSLLRMYNLMVSSGDVPTLASSKEDGVSTGNVPFRPVSLLPGLALNFPRVETYRSAADSRSKTEKEVFSLRRGPSPRRYSALPLAESAFPSLPGDVSGSDKGQEIRVRRSPKRSNSFRSVNTTDDGLFRAELPSIINAPAFLSTSSPSRKRCRKGQQVDLSGRCRTSFG